MKAKGLFQTLQTWGAMASAVLLICVAILGFLYDAVHRFGDHELVSHLASPEQVLILLVALLCGGVGLERLVTLRKIEMDMETAHEQRAGVIHASSKIAADLATLTNGVSTLRHELIEDLKVVVRREKEIMTGITRLNTTEVLLGPRQIEAAARKLIEECDDTEKIKATGQYRASDGLSHAYFQHLADRVAKAQKNRGSMEYYVVVASAPNGQLRDDDERDAAFRAADITDRLRMRGIKHPWPFEVLIAGDSVIIALLTGAAKSKYEVGVKITDHDFVKRASDWYREVVWEGAEGI